MEMEEKIFEFVGWIYKNYGQVGLAVSLVIMLSVLALIFFLLNRLPESKEIKNENSGKFGN